MVLRRIAFVGILAATVGCGRVDLEAEVAALRTADSLWWAKAVEMDAQGAMAFYTKDAVSYPPEGPTEGGEGIQLYLQELFAKPGFAVRFPEKSRIVLAPSGDLGYTFANAELTFDDDEGSPFTLWSRHLAVWRKQPNGKWKITENMWNFPQPFPPEPQAAPPAPKE